MMWKRLVARKMDGRLVRGESCSTKALLAQDDSVSIFEKHVEWVR